MKTIRLIFCDVRLTKFMQGFDVFEPSKVFVCPAVRCNAVDDFGQDQLDKLIAHSQTEPYRLIACLGDDIEWSDPEVKSVSNGQQWTTFEDHLNRVRNEIESLV